MVGVGSPAPLFAYGAALSGRWRVAKGRGERSARAGEVVKSGPGRFWAEGRKPDRKADMEGLRFVNEATLSKSTESCEGRRILSIGLVEGAAGSFPEFQAVTEVCVQHIQVHTCDCISMIVAGMSGVRHEL